MKTLRFIDTSGFYSILARRDSMHSKACGLLDTAAEQTTGFVTTDYVLDETATLLQARGMFHTLPGFFDSIFESRACIIEWMDPDRFIKTHKFFLKHGDHAWSFTDCFSFIVMKERRISEAVTKDRHFEEAGFIPLLV